MVIKADVLYLPVGEVAREFDREYTLEQLLPDSFGPNDLEK